MSSIGFAWGTRMRLTLVFVLSSVLSAATIPVHSGDNLQTAINSATCGDTVQIDTGATFDGTFTLPNKSCGMGTEITINSTASASFGNQRVSPANFTTSAKVRTLGGGTIGAAFELAPGANYWVIDGLEVTDNAATSANVSALIDATTCAPTCGHLTLTRNYMHQKETGTNYNRSVQRAIWFDGDTLLEKWNYVYIIGYYYPDAPGIGNSHTTMDTTDLLSITGVNMTVLDNYVSVWWNGTFMGGSDTAPQNTATLTSASTTSATFSNTTGISSGLVIRFGVQGMGTVSSSGSTGTLTVTSGPTLTSADIGADGLSATIEITDSAPSRLLQCTSIAANVCTFIWVQSSTHPANGSYAFTLYQTAQVSSVVMSTVNYTPNSHDQLLHTPQVAAWNTGTQGLIHDVTIQKNTFYVDPAFAANVFSQNGNCPKGAYEWKMMDTALIDGNYFIGYPAILAMTPANQNGTAPWTAIRNITISNNWIYPDTPSPCKRGSITATDHEDLHTVSPSNNYSITNNVIGPGIQNMLTMRSAEGDNWSITHNTSLNTAGGFDYNTIVTSLVATTNYTFNDNIGDYSLYGMQCQASPFTLATCYPSGTFQNNVIVDTLLVGLTTSQWGSGSLLAPIPTDYASVGFTNLAGQVYSLAASSPYKGAGTMGSDPGVDWTALLTALGTNPQIVSGTTIKGKIRISGKITVH